LIVTVEAWVITTVIVVSIPLVFLRAWRFPEKMPLSLVWTVTAVFALQEMWMVEYRLGMAQAWKSAYLRCTAECQSRQLRQGSLKQHLESSIAHTDSRGAEFLPSPSLLCDGARQSARTLLPVPQPPISPVSQFWSEEYQSQIAVSGLLLPLNHSNCEPPDATAENLAFPLAQEAQLSPVWIGLWFRQRFDDMSVSNLDLAQIGIAADSSYNFNTEAGPTPHDFI
jgi:hypothetical protein